MQGKLIKTLILEDNPEDMLILEKLIKGVKLRDIRFIAVTKLAEAVALLKKDKFDLVISDLTVPDSRGLETFRGLRTVVPKTPIVLLTGMDDEAMAVQAMREGAQDYLIKGEITPNLLLRAASYAIERNTLIQERLKLITELTDAISKIKVLTGLLPICAGCKKIRNDKGYWEQVENYLKAHADIEFTHGFCPDCMERLYPEFMKEKGKQ
jgi:DNA-binding NtrC family response regulator